MVSIFRSVVTAGASLMILSALVVSAVATDVAPPPQKAKLIKGHTSIAVPTLVQQGAEFPITVTLSSKERKCKAHRNVMVDLVRSDGLNGSRFGKTGGSGVATLSGPAPPFPGSWTAKARPSTQQVVYRHGRKFRCFGPAGFAQASFTVTP